jgi:GNAT superfamily N-acetyltransferase
MLSVEPLTSADTQASAGLLTRAFVDNPAMVALFKLESRAERLRALRPCMVGFVASVLRYGSAEGIKQNGSLVAVSLSFRPNGFPPPLLATLIQAPGPVRAGLATALRFAGLDREMHRRHPRYPHWYLWFLGVEPERQGQGLGSRLIQSLAQRAETENVPCYLEADVASNVKLYERHGYRVEAEETLPPIGVNFWFMKRS